MAPLNPIAHAAYAPYIDPEMAQLRSDAPEEDIDHLDRQIVTDLWYRVLRPDDIARKVMQRYGWRAPLTVAQAAVIIMTLGEAGYPIAGNGAPDYEDYYDQDLPPVRGAERARVLTAAAAYWADLASQPLTYVSFGDARGFMPRPVQFDSPGAMHPEQYAALTFGPADSDSNERAYMRRHCRALIRVKE